MSAVPTLGWRRPKPLPEWAGWWATFHRFGGANVWDMDTTLLHRPSNTVYVFVGTALRESDLEPMLVYMNRNTYATWVRPAADFFDAIDEFGQRTWTWGVRAAALMNDLHRLLGKITEERNGSPADDDAQEQSE